MTGNTSSTSLQLTIRLSSSSRFVIGACGTITPTSTIRHVKDIIALRQESGNCAVERQRLIHKGRILSDDGQTLAHYGITGADASSGETVLYLVKGGGSGNGIAGVGGAGAAMTNGTTSSTPVTSTSLPPPAAPTTPFLNFGHPNDNASADNPMANIMNMMGNMGGSGGLGGAGMPDMASIQQQLQQNPQMMSDMMNNPMVQSLMGSPDFLRTMMESNPQMRAVMESNPELRQALEDPELMRRSMQMMRDPSAMQNMMRGQDLAMANIENMPGGFNALRRMYEDVQEPMMDALGGAGSANTTTGNESGATGHSRAAGAANQAMPNPWGAPSSSSTSTNPVAAGGGAANPFASMMGGMGAGGGSTNPFASLMGGIPGAGGAGAANNPWANPMLGPNGQNLESTLQMLENPMMQQMMQQMMSNPDNMRQMMQSNPMLQQMAQTNPQAAAMFENPEMVRSYQ